MHIKCEEISSSSNDETTTVSDKSETETPEVTRDEVKRIVLRLRNWKAAGDDLICAEVLKNNGSAMVDWLMELSQDVWQTKQIPQEWKDATLMPLHKKKDRRICDNYQGILLLSVSGKVLALILLERLQEMIEPQLMEAQCGFRKGCGTVDQIWVVQQIVERAAEYHTPICFSFVDLTKVYDSVNRHALIAILKEYEVSHQLIDIIQELYNGTRCKVRVEGDMRSNQKLGRAVSCPHSFLTVSWTR